jgi:PfaD family protein
MGADYILTGSINQASVQAATSPEARRLLAEAAMADVAMAPAADMFELGAQVQVLKRGTLYAQRARRLQELYRNYHSLEQLPAEERARLERDVFGRSLEEAWAETAAYWSRRDPAQLRRAETDGRHRMALLFRSYLGQSSRWARDGQEGRKSDYQIWCGPAMGLFNHWVAGTWLEPLEQRDAALIGAAILHGAAMLTRAEALARCGVPLPALAELTRPPARERLLACLTPARECAPALEQQAPTACVAVAAGQGGI